MPLKKGYSRAVISNNIREMMDTGHAQNQAIAASLGEALRSYRLRHPGKKLPDYLQKTAWLQSHRHRRLHSRTKKASTRKRNPTRIRGPVDHLIRLANNKMVPPKIGYYDGIGFDTSPRVASRFHSRHQAVKIAKALREKLHLNPPHWFISVISEKELPGYTRYQK